ncbi:MAG: tRNA (adenosine(37)-N6)-threonylcarbamoyltransferase complex ATPase subunit type 1 TsaE, partial [Candidatus Neomarinimicrobiota bacterium]
KTRVGSPTFKLVSEYTGDNLNFNHVDCYRLNNSSDFIDIGGENLLYPVNAVTLIEWAEKIEEILPSGTIRINFYRVEGHPNQRKLKVIGIKA